MGDTIEETRQAQTLNLNLELAAIERIAGLYPEAIRKDVIWLGNYVREQCGRNLDVLLHKTRTLGFKTDKTTFSKILRGRYDTDAKGNPTPPIISAHNFRQIVDALRSDAKYLWLEGRNPFIETEVWEEIKNYIEWKWAPNTICKFGLIVGHTGTQKTTCLKHFQHLNNSGRCVHLEAPEKPTMGRFVRELAKAFGIPEKTCGEKLRLRINDNIDHRKCIIIDNIQRLYKATHGWQQEIFNFLQKLQDDTNCTIILCAVPDFKRTLSAGTDRGYFEQFMGRIGCKILTLDDYPSRDDIITISEAYGFKEAAKHVEQLEALTKQAGRIRILFDVLQTAKRAADEKKRPVTYKYIQVALNQVKADDVDEQEAE